MNAEAGKPDKQQRPLRRRIVRILRWIGIVVMILAVLGVVYQSMMSAADRRNYPPAGEVIDMGGYDLHLLCEGTGSPTVVLIPGAGDIAQIWEPVQNIVQGDTRVCSYDRPGLGWSDFAPDGEQTIASQMTILHDLLEAADEEGPYIVVGHSIGGVMARTFATAYPDETVGVVLVDSSIEGQFSVLPSQIGESNQNAGLIFTFCRFVSPFGIPRLLGLGTARANAFDLLSEDAQAAIAATFHQTRGCAALQRDGAVADDVLYTGEPAESLGDIPLIVITRGLAEQDVDPGVRYSSGMITTFTETQEIWLEIQADLLELSTNSRQIIAEESGHYVHTTQPQLVAEAIQSLIE
ncbi:MAG: alpha/beta hydrolase [Anaerolineae bacterium]